VKRVSLFITCLCDMFHANIGKATVEILENAGCEVDFPEKQTCCGQPAFNSGYTRQSKKAMKQIMKAFSDSEFVVAPSGSCIGMLKEYPNIFAGDEIWEESAIDLAAKAYELTEFLVDVLNIVDTGSKFRGKVTYHPSCHMARILGVKDAPIKLLEQIKGIELIDLPLQEDCCGFGGTFSVKNTKISTEMAKEKASHVSGTKAHYVVGGDVACLMNIGGLMSRECMDVHTMHIAEVLNFKEGE